MLGVRFCARAFSSCGERGPLFIVVHGPLTVATSLVAEHRLQTRRLSSCGSRAQLLRGIWDPPRPGREPASPALAVRLSTTAPPGKPLPSSFNPLSPTSHEVTFVLLLTHSSDRVSLVPSQMFILLSALVTSLRAYRAASGNFRRLQYLGATALQHY